MTNLTARDKVALHEAALAEFTRKLYLREIDLKAGELAKRDLSAGSVWKAPLKQMTDQAQLDIRILRCQVNEHEDRLRMLRPLAEAEEAADEQTATSVESILDDLDAAIALTNEEPAE